MNTIKIFSILICSVILVSCGSGDQQSIRDDARSSLSVPENVAPPASTPATPSTTVANNSGVQHYICPNDCAGSGGPSAGTCPVCGSAYEHNQAWHNQPNQTTTPSTTITPGANPITPGTITPPPSTEPAQNAAGVWHYTCSNGCTGGAGSAVACGTCGSTLVHNAAYHN